MAYKRKLLKSPSRIYEVRGRQYGAPPMPAAYERRGGTPEGWLSHVAERKGSQLARREGKTRVRLASSVQRGMSPEFAATKMEGRYGTPYTEELARYKPEQAIQTSQAFVAPERAALGVRGLGAEVGAQEFQTGRLPALAEQQDIATKQAQEVAVAEEQRQAAEEERLASQFARTEALAGEQAPIETELLQQQVEGAPITPGQQYERKQAELGKAQQISADPSIDPEIANFYAQEVQRLQTELAGLEVQGSPLPAPKLDEAIPERFTAPPTQPGITPERYMRTKRQSEMGLDIAGLGDLAGRIEGATSAEDVQALVSGIGQALDAAPNDTVRERIIADVKNSAAYRDLIRMPWYKKSVAGYAMRKYGKKGAAIRELQELIGE